MDPQALRDPDCTDCPLYKGCRTVCMSGSGPLSSEILLVGEAPGENEDETGEPFTGASGKLLRLVMEECGYPRDVRITNTVRCRPPGNRNPVPAEIKACRRWLDAEMDAMPNLKLVIALGSTAIRLSGKAGIKKHRGNPLPFKGRHGITLFPVYHPAFVMRFHEYADEFMALMKQALTVKTGIDPDMVKVLKGKAGETAIRSLLKLTKPVAFDLETTSLDPDKGSILNFGYYAGVGKPVSVEVDTPGALKAVKAFCSSEVPKIVHNVAFEGLWSEVFLSTPLYNVVADTRLLSMRDDNRRPNNLGSVTSALLPELAGFKVDTESILESGGTMETMDPLSRAVRNGLDCLATYRIWQKLKGVVSPSIHQSVDLRIAMLLARFKVRGVAFDGRVLDEMGKRKEAEAAAALKAMAAVGITANPASPKALGKNLEALGVRTGRKTTSGQMGTDEEALLNLLSKFPSAEKWVRPILDWRGAMKFKGTYIEGFRKHIVNNLIRPDMYWPINTWRPACRRPNLLNLPKGEFRKAVVSRYKGGCILASDYSQIELRVAASLSGDPVMLRIYKEGGDIHHETALGFYGEGYPKTVRIIAKGVNFGTMYGQGPQTLQATLREGGVFIAQGEAKKWIETWKKKYSVLWAYMEKLQEEALANCFVTAPSYGIIRRIDTAVGGTEHELMKKAREGANMPIQCGAVMMTLRAALKVEERLGDRGVVILVPYDEIVVDCRPGEGLRVAQIVRDAMHESASEEPWMRVPVETDVKTGPSWGEQEKVTWPSARARR